MGGLEDRHEAFMKRKYCGTVHVLDGSLSKEDLVAQAVEKIKLIKSGTVAGLKTWALV